MPWPQYVLICRTSDGATRDNVAVDSVSITANVPNVPVASAGASSSILASISAAIAKIVAEMQVMLNK